MIDIEVQCRREPAALAALIARTMRDGVLIEREIEVAHLTMLLAVEDLEQVRARYPRAGSESEPRAAAPDPDNDWSSV